MQIIYNSLTPLTLDGGFPPGRKFNPAVVANVFIAVFHAISLFIFIQSVSDASMISK